MVGRYCTRVILELWLAMQEFFVEVMVCIMLCKLEQHAAQRKAGEWSVETIGTTFCVEAASFVGTENALCSCKTKDRNEEKLHP